MHRKLVPTMATKKKKRKVEGKQSRVPEEATWCLSTTLTIMRRHVTGFEVSYLPKPQPKRCPQKHISDDLFVLK